MGVGLVDGGGARMRVANVWLGRARDGASD